MCLALENVSKYTNKYHTKTLQRAKTYVNLFSDHLYFDLQNIESIVLYMKTFKRLEHNN